MHSGTKPCLEVLPACTPRQVLDQDAIAGRAGAYGPLRAAPAVAALGDLASDPRAQQLGAVAPPRRILAVPACMRILAGARTMRMDACTCMHSPGLCELDEGKIRRASWPFDVNVQDLAKLVEQVVQVLLLRGAEGEIGWRSRGGACRASLTLTSSVGRRRRGKNTTEESGSRGRGVEEATYLAGCRRRGRDRSSSACGDL